MRRLRRTLAVGIVNVVVFALLAEVVALAVWYAREHTLFYGRPGPAKPTRQEISGAGSGTQVLHPILGFIRSPSLPVTRIVGRERLDRMVGRGVVPGWLGLRANNYGFFSGEDYPTRGAADGDIVIGVFGGSAAQWFALQGGERLSANLLSIRPERFGRVRILCFAQGAFKQPQQLQTLTYFLAAGQKFDLVINIDGFNEAALAALNAARGIDTSMPSSQQMLPLLGLIGGATASREYLEASLSASRSAERLTRIEGWLERNRSAAVQLFLEALRRRARNSYGRAVRALDALSTAPGRTALVQMNEIPPAIGADDARLYERIADLWMRSSMLMDAVARGAGARYLHVLQPNQYYTNRVFDEQERSIAIDPASPYRVPIVKGYPEFIARLPELQKRGVAAVSAVRIFDGIPGTVYSDSCCHYNQRGNEILADFIARAASDAFDRPVSFRP